MIPAYFIILCFVIVAIGDAAYVREIIQGKTKPNRVTWFLWTLTSLIAFVGEVKGGVGVASLAVFAEALGPVVILACSYMNKNSYWEITRSDLVCGALALLALLALQFAHDQNYAIALAMLTDFFACLPALHKAWVHPDTENDDCYLLSLVGNIIGLMCVQTPDFTSYAYLVWGSLINALLYLFVSRKKIVATCMSLVTAPLTFNAPVHFIPHTAHKSNRFHPFA
jgi:hypothetical protein